MGYLYVIGTDNGLVKIGITERHVKERVTSLQTGCPFKITKVWTSENIDGYQKCERLLHAVYADYRTNGEWFQVPIDSVIRAAERACSDYADDAMITYINDIYDRIMRVEDDVRALKYGKYKPPAK